MNAEEIEKKLQNMEALIKNQEGLIKTLENQVRILQDIEEITKLQRAYGYYLEYWMVDEILDCFSDNPEAALYWLDDTWLGKAGVRRYFESAAIPDPRFMHQLMQLSGVIDVDPDGKRAKGRWYGFGGMRMPRGDKEERVLTGGLYENEYIKEDGKWKILSLSWTQPYIVQISEGWITPEQRRKLHGGSKLKPDIPLTSDQRWVSGHIRPFHYKHPVTGKKTSEDTRNARLKKYQPE
jgi:hypothetical protein